MVYDPYDYFMEDVLRKGKQREKIFRFDRVFGHDATQKQVYECVECQVDAVLNGFNATVFAYGSTGTGKTFTMMGTEDEPGVMALTLESLFDKIDCLKNGKYRISISYLEIYNEKIRDLLTGKNDYLELQEDQVRGVVVSGISYMSAANPQAILALLRKGNKNRIQEATGANETSSRSHAILQVYVSFKSVDNKTRFSKLSLIDLAGSERAIQTNNRGLRMLEGANINRSLLALGNCINSLVDIGKKEGYVNYRDSKLTRLLKDSLGGNCRTIMIANISPAASNFEETMNTLKYASRARNIKTKISQQLSESYLTALQEFKEDFAKEDKSISSKQASSVSIKSEKSVELDLMAKLHMIFCKQLEVRTAQLDQEEKEANISRTIQLQEFELFQLENQVKYLKSEDKKTECSEKASLVQQRIKDLQEQQKLVHQTQTGLQKEMDELEAQVEDISNSLEDNDVYSMFVKAEIKVQRLEIKNLSLEIKAAIMNATAKQKDEQMKHSNEILDLYRSITILQRQTSGQVVQPEAIAKMEEQLSILIQAYNNKSHGEFLIDSLELPPKLKVKPSALSKIKSALGLSRFLQKSDSVREELGSIQSLQSSITMNEYF
jgi:kinesin family protein 18/19